MILILSQGACDPTTEYVADWIDALGGEWERINGEDLESTAWFCLILDKNGSTFSISILGKEIEIARVAVVWFRRWHRHQGLGAEAFRQEGPLYAAVLSHQVKELGAMTRVLFSNLKQARWLTAESSIRPNKWLVLRHAAAIGLDIPSTLMTNSKKAVTEFKQVYKRVIVKPMADGSGFPCGPEIASMYTAELTDELLSTMPDSFFPSLLQEMIPKLYEIRTFYLRDTFYSMAIFSQSDPQTCVDFRRYNRRFPNRTVPYRLPDDLCGKLRRLMQEMELETASIDLVRGIDGRVVFLEVNPVGQFGWLSQACNYNLEKRMAEHLLYLELEHGKQESAI